MLPKICPHMQKQAWSSLIRGAWVCCGYLIDVFTFLPQVPLKAACFLSISVALHFELISPYIDHVQRQLGLSLYTRKTILMTYLREYSSARLPLCRTSKKTGISCLHQALCALLKHPPQTVYNFLPQQLYSCDRSHGPCSSLLQKSFATGSSSREVNKTDFFPWKPYKESLQFVRLKVQHHVTPSLEPMAHDGKR